MRNTHSLLAVVILLACSSLHARTVRVGVYDNPPKVSLDNTGKPCGIFIDIIEHIASREQWNIEYVHVTWDEGLARLEEARIDLMPDVAYSPERDKRFNFNKLTVLSSWLQAYCRNDLAIKSVADFNGRKVAVLKSGIQQRVCGHLREQLGLDFELLDKPDYAATIEAVNSGEADIVVLGRFYAFGKRTSRIVPTPVLLNPSTLHYAAPKKRNKDLLAAIDKHLAAMQNDGHSVYYQSLVTWLHEEPRFFIPRYVIWAVVIFSTVAVFLFLASMALKWQVKQRTRELENALRKLKTAQDEALKRERLYAFGQLGSGVAHDFNNLLTPIVGNSDMLLQPGGLDDQQEARRGLKLIFRAAEHGRELVARMQKFYRNARIAEQREKVDINAVIREVVDLAATRWKKATATSKAPIQVVLNLGKNTEIIGRMTVCHELFLNLVLNAVDAMPQGGTLEISTEKSGDSVKIAVKDTGVGMTEEARQKCLEPFFTTKGDQGTGMGLTMVNNIVKEHGGKIDIQSAVGKGTTITIVCSCASDNAEL
ncbi:MAG: transporter substrate-binding domain-containing protein [Chitinispirillaceae bacterium]|nr:transporter substrate-binding domain-containing protein [Chitinispirillaceae bacterium]